MESLRITNLGKVDSDISSTVEKQRLKETCEDFEAVLTGYLFRSMRQSVGKEESETEGLAEGFYYEMLDQAVARELSRRPGLGLAKLLYEQLSSNSRENTEPTTRKPDQPKLEKS